MSMNPSSNTIKNEQNTNEKLKMEHEKSVFEEATQQQKHQFQTGIDNLQKEIESIFQLKSKFTPIVGNRVSRFINIKSRFQ
ncbi:hypothetical protein [uncultured Kordia sp.]|uniref:hypothetical protein n=1 Tax=uncultured Kordia sp. TaxID=507699 RepID=UPI002606592D|nr:hypothetical protein [uncultured Kordia sp.]